MHWKEYLEVKRDFVPPIFFKDGFIPSPILGIYRFFEFAFKFQEIFAIFNWLSAIIYSGESILPILFNTESCNSPYHYSRESLFVRIICINSCLSFSTDSRYSRIVYLGESLLPALFIEGSHCWQQRVIFKNFEGICLPSKDKNNYAYRVLHTKS